MKGILYSRVREFIRQPFTFLIFTAMAVIFALLVGGSGPAGTIVVPVYGDKDIQEEMKSEIQNQEYFTFEWVSKEELETRINDGDADVGILLYEDDFDLIVGVESTHLGMIRQTIQQEYVEKEQEMKIQEAAIQAGLNEDEVLESYLASKEDSLIEIEKTSFQGEQDWLYDGNIHRIAGFSLFFAIYTIAYNVLHILVEKRNGMWDRMILSPLKKTEMYISNLIYSFFEGYIQICLIFAIFHYGFNIDFNGRFLEVLLLLIPYVLAIVALSILITAIVKNSEQFNAVISIVAVSLAMIGGAFWPLEIVENKFLLFLADLNPLKYGLEIVQGLSVYNYPLAEMVQPVSVLLFMTVLFTGIGIHLMERRHI
ncbi:ABC transporter permease [Oceanobacillus kimchii]|uniref:ABC transporter permease n=1 Tax=Oceanobacillus kimchii TaxID=746691 RepID=UPI0021A64ACA|nr:ABC transporter permease [Oceanobacillus kimchii]MCT1578583.1 ABC transporter permease [Oceanobacillus kimchii]MCT2136368.1 ABC transporter permease [Oceanobacillus kimchii]